MKYIRLIFLWTFCFLNVLEPLEAGEEQKGYIFTCPRSIKIGSTNQLHFRRFENYDAGELRVKLTYGGNYRSSEATLVEKSFEIKEGEVDSVLTLNVENIDHSVNSGKITINGTFGDYRIGGSTNIRFYSAKDYIGLIQTDKPFYKEGQTVKFRVMRMNNELKPAVQDNADIWIDDPVGTRLYQLKNVSLGKGIQQFEFPLTNEPVKGQWKISASFKGDISTTNFEVKEYVLPKFEVTIQEPPFVLEKAEKIPITICAKYTYGKNVKGKFNLTASSWHSPWYQEKITTLKRGEEIDGCIDYNISVSMIEKNKYYDTQEIKIFASVEEDGTGVQRNVTITIERYETPLILSFNNEIKQFYKPGLPYNEKLFVKHPDDSPAADEDVEICYTVSRERVVLNGKWKATRTAKYCQNYTSDEGGEIQFALPRQNTDSLEINLEVKCLKYLKATGISQHYLQQSMTLKPWYSPSSSFIQLLPHEETLPCGTTRKVKVLFTSNEDAIIKFYYQVIHRGKIMQRGCLETSFSVKDDVSYKYEDGRKAIDGSEVQIFPTIDSFHSPESAEEECKSTKDARYLPPIGEVDILINIESSLSPSFLLLVYYIRDDRETVADSQKFNVEKCFKNEVKLTFGDDGKQPGTKTSIRVTSSPSSLCGIKVVDKSVTLLDSDDQLTAEKIFKMSESFDSEQEDNYEVNHCEENAIQPGINKHRPIRRERSQYWPSSSEYSIYEDSITAFQMAHFIVISDFILLTRPCKSRGYDNDAILEQSISIEKPTKSVVDVRNYFPDTWLFDMKMTGEDGVYTTKEKLPHTITEWVGTAACINEEDGLGLSNIATIKGFQAFFISINVPYSVVRGETVTIPVSVFSYVDSALPVTVTLDDTAGFEIEEWITRDFCIQPQSSINLKLLLKATGLGKQNITIRAVNAQFKDVCGRSDMFDRVAKDAITSSLLVEPEGWPAVKVESSLFCPNEEENKIFKKTFYTTEIYDVVANSSRFYIDVSGSLLGKSMDNLENLVQLPTGCGEQNMVKFAPNVVVMDFLVDAKKLNPELERRIVGNLNTGAEHQSNYKHPDGSYSAFGKRDEEGSMFLTAFVLRYFSKASKYITIDDNAIEQMQDWIASKQKVDGCFPDVGIIIQREMKGGLNKSDGTITAYVLASLLTSRYQNKTVLDRAFSCLRNDKENTLYAQMLYAYADALAGNLEAANERLKSVEIKSSKEGGTDYYHDVYATKSQDVETSAYFVSAFLKSSGKAADVLPVVQYLIKNMNPLGGFASTQDTVVTLDALSQFAMKTFKDTVDINVKATGSLEREILISEDDKLLSKRYKVNHVPSEVSIEARGSGCAVIQSILRYNTKTSHENKHFDIYITGKCLDEKCKKGSVSMFVSYVPKDKKTGMALIEVKLISGWSPLKESLEMLMENELLKLMRYDVQNNIVIFYFNEILNEEKHFMFEVEQIVEVSNSQPGSATVYDYYNKDISSSASYTFGN